MHALGEHESGFAFRWEFCLLFSSSENFQIQRRPIPVHAIARIQDKVTKIVDLCILEHCSQSQTLKSRLCTIVLLPAVVR